MAKLRQLVADGYEDLGTVALGGTIVGGDPSLLAGALGTGGWWGAAVRPGRWQLLGKPWARDPDLLEEVVLVHDELVDRFYDLYDMAEHQAALLLPTARIAVLAGALRTDADTLQSAATAEAEGLPWLLDQGCVIGGIGQNPAQIAAPRGASAELVMVSVGLTRAPEVRAETVPFVQDRSEDE
jgi:hypothetical protein